MEDFELYIYSFGFAGFDLCSFAARLIIIAEFLLGLSLVLNIFFKQSRWLTAASLAGFSAFLIWRAALGDTESCHCMGNLADMNPVQSLIKNLILAVLLAYAWNSEGRVWRRQGLVAVLSAVASVGILFSMTPPDLFYRIGDRTSEDLSPEKFRPVADSLGLSSGRRIVCFYSAGCEHCRHCASKMSGIISRHSLPADSISVLFMQTHTNQDSVATAFFKEHGGGLELPYSYLHPYSFLPLTNGAMPLVVLLEDGEIIREYDYLSIDEKAISDYFRYSK